MKPKQWAILLLAMWLMAAAPPDQRYVPPTSLWSRFVAAAKRLVHVPFGQPRHEPANWNAPRAGSVLSTSPPEHEATVRRDDDVRQATAVEPAAEATRTARKPWLFSRPERPSRTVSDFMAEEKP